ncbi:hypothetical protein RvY_10726 [Ramazzottius varieornatus]|uniref:TATA box-binding protein-like 1 n=1 Tax=Ramazzottius varieornatus TaxID=947166 RepID=A0A1D1VDP3_RAMVA|nr:hypothetical protein RvY_10726 [Ramazzottius varieornatus]
MAAVLSQSAQMSSSTVVHPISNNRAASADSLQLMERGAAPSIINGRYPAATAEADLPQKQQPPLTQQVDVVNVLCNFKTHCHLDLRTLAMKGSNVVFRRDPSSVLMKLRSVPVTASIWSTGRVVCMGARSEKDALIGARRIARKIQKCGFQLRFVDYQIKNVLAVASLPFGVRIDKLKDAFSREVSYEPELHPAASWRLPDIGGQMQIFQTGSVSITAPNVATAQLTFDTIFPKLRLYSKPKESDTIIRVLANGKKSKATKAKGPAAKKLKTSASMVDFEDLEEMDLDDDDDDDSESE